MSDSPANPILVGLLFILRCFIPILALLGISYLLRKLGLVTGTEAPKTEEKKAGRSSPNKKRRPGA
jgi:hypothetical protein